MISCRPTVAHQWDRRLRGRRHLPWTVLPSTLKGISSDGIERSCAFDVSEWASCLWLCSNVYSDVLTFATGWSFLLPNVFSPVLMSQRDGPPRCVLELRTTGNDTAKRRVHRPILPECLFGFVHVERGRVPARPWSLSALARRHSRDSQSLQTNAPLQASGRWGAVCRRRCSIGCSSARQLLGSRADPSPPPSPSTSKVGVNCIREQSFRDPQCSYKWEERRRSISKSCVRLCSQPHGSYIFRVLPSRSQSPTARGQTRRQFKLV